MRWNVDAQDRKLNQRITRRKEKVQRLIEEQEAILATLDSVNYQHQQDYHRALGLVRNKLYQLRQELSVLDSGRLRDEV
jgi:hypothetical protein